MAAALPPALKIPEISRFINRANQLRSIKPAIAYWCEYHAVNQIVSKSLHTTDDDCFAFTKALIERLEATKNERADDDAIVDNTAGQAYVEQFAQETFSRAERTMVANKVTRQTADTFDAAATFFDLTHEWGEPEADVLQKIKFAKWNAARILKAIREGRDPNESNPKVEPEDTLDPGDPEVQQITGVTVEDVPDAGEGYFPAGAPFAPSPMSQSPGAGAAAQPAPEVSPVASPQVPRQPSPQITTKLPSQFAPPPPEPTGQTATPPPATEDHIPPPTHHLPPVTDNLPLQASPAPVPPASGAERLPAPAAAVSHKGMEQAQKHAKWAISALNFEDVPTAIQELRNALATLGTQ